MRIGRTLSQRVVTALLALTMLVGMGTAGAQVATAQTDGNQHTFETGEALTWDSEWEIDPTATISDGGIESILLSSDGSLLMVMGMPNGFALDEARDIVLDSFLEVGDDTVTIDRGAYGAVSYSLDRMTLDDVEFGVFTLFRSGDGSSPTFAYVFVSITGFFTSEFEKAQNGITLDGAGLFDGVNGKGLQDQLEASGSETADDGGEDVSTPEDEPVEPTPEDEGTEGGTRTGGLKGDTGSTSDDATDDGADDGTEATDTPAGSGLVDDFTFVSPTYGTVIAWESPLALDVDRETYVLENEDGRDFVALITEGEAGSFVTVTVLSAGESTPADYVDVWTSPDFIANIAFSEDSEVVLSESSKTVGAVARVDMTDQGTEVIFYSEVHYDEANDAIILIEYSTAFQMFDQTFADAQAGLTVNGDPVLDFFAPDEIAEAAGI